jgi:thiamine-monophosphate kinase
VDCVPLSSAFSTVAGDDLDARLAAMSAGDDYGLLFAAPPAHTARIREIAAALDCQASVIGTVAEGEGIALVHREHPVPLPDRLGYQH